jgi:hypothetical protein
MDQQNITNGNIRATTQSDFSRAQYHRMGKSGPVSDYWKRLTSMPSFKGATQEGVAKAVLRIAGIKYGQSAMHKWKVGPTQPPVETSRKLAEHNGYSAEWLISGQGNPRPNDSRVDWPFPEVPYERVASLLREQPHLLPIFEGQIKSCLLRLEGAQDQAVMEAPATPARQPSPQRPPASARRAR